MCSESYTLTKKKQFESCSGVVSKHALWNLPLMIWINQRDKVIRTRRNDNILEYKDYCRYSILGTILVVACILTWCSRDKIGEEGRDNTHEYDCLRKINNLLPKWWFNISWVTIFSILVYQFYSYLNGCFYLFLIIKLI